MRFTEVLEGPWRIYAGALESPIGDGFTAAVVVQHGTSRHTAWRDDTMACGHRWASAEEALRYAVAKGREVVRAGGTMTPGRAAPGPAALTQGSGTR